MASGWHIPALPDWSVKQNSSGKKQKQVITAAMLECQLFCDSPEHKDGPGFYFTLLVHVSVLSSPRVINTLSSVVV